MENSRRRFFTNLGMAISGATIFSKCSSKEEQKSSDDYYGLLIDTTLCVGCRSCEFACNSANSFPKPKEEYDENGNFTYNQRPDSHCACVINKYNKSSKTGQSITVKTQCMHCVNPACVSSCLVGALTKDEKTGAIIYDDWKCMGCRYCMVACPFGIPSYDYNNAISPLVVKCQLCHHKISKPYPEEVKTDQFNKDMLSKLKTEKEINFIKNCYELDIDKNTYLLKKSLSSNNLKELENILQESGYTIPACAEVCPTEAIKYGKRKDLLKAAKERISKQPNRYYNYIYGENEVGGTQALYISEIPPDKLGFLVLPKEAPPKLTEDIQHGVFKYFLLPISLFAILGGLMWITGRKKTNDVEDNKKDDEIGK